jgi:KDO2-lipid IV(A) lauroyltransferase
MKKITDLLWYVSISLIFTLLRLLPRKAVLALGRTLGRTIFRLDKKHRDIALKNLETALGREKSEPQREEIAGRAFRYFGAAFCDLIHLSGRDPEYVRRQLTIEGMEHFRTALEKGKGVLLFTAHYGLWEIAPSLINQLAPMSVIARPMDNPHLEKKLTKIREGFGSAVVSKFDAMRHVLRALRKNEIVAILIDQNVLTHEAVFVDFFGKPAATTPGLGMFHLRTGAALIPAFLYPTPAGTYRIEVSPPLEVSLTGDAQKDILHITQLSTQKIEDQVRKLPEYWFWFHDRWKSRPVSEHKEV